MGPLSKNHTDSPLTSLRGICNDYANIAGAVLSLLCLLVAATVAWSLFESSNQNLSTQRLDTYLTPAEKSGAEASHIFNEINKKISNQTPQSIDKNKPTWLFTKIPQQGLDLTRVVEFEVLRFDEARFWIATGDDPKNPEFKSISPLSGREGLSSKGGFAIKIPRGTVVYGIAAEIRAYLVGEVKAQLWTLDGYAASERAYERKGGALFGSMLILAAFSAIVAMVNKDLTFLLFAGWAVTSLRIAAVNAGWDRVWFGLDMDNDTYLVILRILIAAYGYFTFALFKELTQKNNTSKLHVWKHHILEKGFLVFVFASPILSHIDFLRYFWTYATIALGTLTLQVVYFVIRHRSRLSMWYALSWGCMILGMISEIGTKSGWSHYPLWINSQAASVVSALIMGLALAERLRTERDGRLAAQARSLKYLKKYEDNFNSVPVGLFILNQDGTVRLRNPAFDAIFNLSDDFLKKSPHFDSFTSSGFFDHMRHAACANKPEVEIESFDHQGVSRWFLARITQHDGLVEGSIQDITTRKAAEDQLKHLVDHDQLTGLQNRRGLEATLERVLHSVRHGLPCALACVEIDRFKLVNDLHGHAAGDALLAQAADRLRATVRATDSLARVADSFIVLFFDCTLEAGAHLAERIRLTISRRPFEFDRRGMNITASVGLVSLTPSMNVVNAMAAADRACMEAKTRGRNCVVQFSDGDNQLQMHLEELRVVADLQRHIPTDRYFLEFQPIVALQPALNDMNYEVLIRMRGEQGQPVPPGRFIGAAERNGLMSQIDRWVLRTIMAWLEDHPAHLSHVGFVSVNLSGASLNDTRFAEDAFSMMAEHPNAVQKLCFEITESVALNDISSTRHFVQRLRHFGAKVALDDFGAGYTSFNYLREIPADFIKIDGSFIRDINRSPANYAITRMMVDLTHELGMICVAEWAENRDTVASLMELGVDYGQGFGLVRPTAPELLNAVKTSRELIRDPDMLALLQQGVAPRADRPHTPGAPLTAAPR
jgi:diguanylate cyclase (GGDEF)-like protein/PAS domain S-box-containing protein